MSHDEDDPILELANCALYSVKKSNKISPLPLSRCLPGGEKKDKENTKTRNYLLSRQEPKQDRDDDGQPLLEVTVIEESPNTEIRSGTRTIPVGSDAVITTTFTTTFGAVRDDLQLVVALPSILSDSSISTSLLKSTPTSTSTSISTPSLASVENILQTNIGTHLLLHDELVNIWEFCIHPGERCAFHSHKLPYIFINLTKSLTQALDINGNPVGDPLMQVVGQTTFVDNNSLGSHAVRNVGDQVFIQFVVEFKQFFFQ